MRIAFLLPSRPGGGGVHSVVDESIELARLGLSVSLLVPEHTISSYDGAYPGLMSVLQVVPADAADPAAQLSVQQYDVVVATVYTTVSSLAKRLGQMAVAERPLAAYYVQDYEPFFEVPGTAAWEQAKASYEELSEMVLFAKTAWLQAQVTALHRRAVELVEPSLNQAIYRPLLGVPLSKHRVLAAMVRPATPRRAPRRTVAALNRVAEIYGDEVAIHTFGCTQTDLEQHALRLDPRIGVHGELRREDVAALLRRSSFFLDLSDYQAFGRTALEAMASGCVPIVPNLGGVREYATDGINALLLDSADPESVKSTLDDAMGLAPSELAALRSAALAKAARYSVRRAALSIYDVLQRHVDAR